MIVRYMISGMKVQTWPDATRRDVRAGDIVFRLSGGVENDLRHVVILSPDGSTVRWRLPCSVKTVHRRRPWSKCRPKLKPTLIDSYFADLATTTSGLLCQFTAEDGIIAVRLGSRGRGVS